MEELNKLYGSAEGIMFRGEVLEPQTMYKKEWTVIEMRDEIKFEIILDEIHRKGDGKVWKGFTGPPEYENYRIWVQLPAREGDTGNFTVTGYKQFQFKTPSSEYTKGKGYYFQVKI